MANKNPKNLELSEKQEVFIAAFLKDFNTRKAATVAGYKFPDQEGWRLLKNPKVRERINEHLEAIKQEGLGSKAYRLRVLNQMFDKVLDVVEEEGVYQKAFTQQGKEYPRFANDVLSELRAIMEQAAKEVGDRDKRIQLEADVSVSNEPSQSAIDRLQALINSQGE